MRPGSLTSMTAFCTPPSARTCPRSHALRGGGHLELPPVSKGERPMRNTAVRDRITKQFRDAAAAVQALAIQQDEGNSGPMKGGFPMGGGTSGYAPRTPAGASRAAGGGTGTVPGAAPTRRGPVKSRAPVPVLPPHAHQRSGPINGRCGTSSNSGRCPALCPVRGCMPGSWSTNGVSPPWLTTSSSLYPSWSPTPCMRPGDSGRRLPCGCGCWPMPSRC